MNNKSYLVIIAILALVCAWLGYEVFSKGEKIDEQVELIDQGDLERERLEIDLMKMQLSYDTLYTSNTALSAEMADQKAQIDELLKKVKDRNWSVSKLKKETATLRDIMKGYVVTIDSLNTMNQELLAQNENMRVYVENVEDEVSQLREKQGNMEKIISTGKSLQATSSSAVGVRIRNNGKQSETGRASKAEMIKTCFTVLKNSIAEKGEKTLYARVIAPNGKVLDAKDGRKEGNFEGEKSNYSVARNIDYQGEEMMVCLYYDLQGVQEKGDYKILLYENERLMGSADLTLN